MSQSCNVALLLAVDIGGTFTDLVLTDEESGAVFVAKVLTSYPDPSIAVLEGINTLLNREQIPPTAVKRIIHGTTLVTNSLIERKGASTALLTTAGFRDALEIGNEGRYDLYDLGLVKPDPLVERRLRLEVHERMTAAGHVYRPLDEDQLRVHCARLRHEGIEAVAVCFLHAYINPAHELAAGEILAEELPDVAVTLSHRVAPAMREYQRASTTVANAYVQPITAAYMDRIRRGLYHLGVTAPLYIMLSSGGTTTVETASAFPVRLVESGPAGGALAGLYWGRRAGCSDLFAFDMGGTTAKAVLTRNGALSITNDAEVAHVHRFKRGSGLPLLTPMIEMIEIGAGGGSIARLNALGLPAVGPRSAGSSPGPACYARGGTDATVSDADLLLGYLNPDYFAAGSIPLDREAAHRALAPLARALGTDVQETAWGIHQLVNENMAAAARVHAAENGLNIRNYAMVATGGAGPVHACGVAERLGIETVIVPPLAGVGSAFGFLQAPIAFDFTRSYLARLDQVDPADLSRLLAEMEEEGRRIVAEANISPDEIAVMHSVDMRYVGQGYEIRVPFAAGPVDGTMLERIRAGFESEYAAFYGRLCEGVPIQAVNWRVVVSGPMPSLDPVAATARADMPGRRTHRPVRFAQTQPVSTPVIRRTSLSAGAVMPGPLVVEEAESTTVVPPGWTLQVGAGDCLVLRRVPDGEETRG